MESDLEADEREEAGVSPTQRHPNQVGLQTPRPRQRMLNARAVGPYSSPRKISFTPNPLKSVASSDLSPYPPFSEKQLKEETKETRLQIELIAEVLAQLYGERADQETVVAGHGAVRDFAWDFAWGAEGIYQGLWQALF